MIKTLFKAFEVRWKSYRHRFVPWIALNLQRNERTLRQVKDRSKDKILPDKEQIYSSDEHKQYCDSCAVMRKILGFCIERKRSSLQHGGTGVFVTRGHVQRGNIVAMYPGTIYQVDEPIFFQSIQNPFVFRCIDGMLIDGNDKAISKIVYRSCSGRDRLGPFHLSDCSWLTSNPVNPLAVGQYVNNCSNGKCAIMI
ncbi:SET domain-containing protein 9 isoform X2 [Paramisgurnus dabryanus]|uniref:SET domain-containing protein 9 isoform X2 n=1 Tax=Paramisgurnus dabryanus TaxID=90735 RepID=UPI003CCF805C